MIPFDMKWNRPGEIRPDPNLPNADKALADNLKSEYEGILCWLVEGAVKYGSEGLAPPHEVVAFTQVYIESQDLLARWIKDCCVPCAIEEGLASQMLFASYRSYCRQEDECPQIDTGTSLSKKLSALGYASKKTNLGKQFALRTTEDLQGVAKDLNEMYCADKVLVSQSIEVMK